MNKVFFSPIYTAPVISLFSILSLLVFLIDKTIVPELISSIFSAAGNQNGEMPFNWQNPLDYLKFFIHIFAHSNWTTLAYNLTVILLLGPAIEQRYGSLLLILMFVIIAFVSAVLNAVFFDTTLLGSDGISFLIIILTVFGKPEVPDRSIISVFILVLYVGLQINYSVQTNSFENISATFGGLCATLLAFFGLAGKKKRSVQKRKKPQALS
ncbi:MAG: rhomboid family intramembrane serine protease [Spirochaetales bacterium]